MPSPSIRGVARGQSGVVQVPQCYREDRILLVLIHPVNGWGGPNAISGADFDVVSDQLTLVNVGDATMAVYLTSVTALLDPSFDVITWDNQAGNVGKAVVIVVKDTSVMYDFAVAAQTSDTTASRSTPLIESSPDDGNVSLGLIAAAASTGSANYWSPDNTNYPSIEHSEESNTLYGSRYLQDQLLYTPPMGTFEQHLIASVPAASQGSVQVIVNFGPGQSATPGPDSQNISITNTGGGVMSWTASKTQDWLTITPTSGTTASETDTITASVDPSGLAVGQYTDTITITSPNASNSPQTIPVTLNVTASTDTTPPSFNIVLLEDSDGDANPETMRISRVAGRDSIGIEFDVGSEAITEWKCKIVPSSISTHDQGVLLKTGGAMAANSGANLIVTDDDIVAAEGAAIPGNKIIKIFVKDAAGNWST